MSSSFLPLADQAQVITLGGGCFWCLEAVYERAEGVISVESGYANGHDPRPTYEAVCSGQTGHVEVVRVQFDPARLSLQDVLRIFFTIHDPTTLNRQGNDVGTQYRSGIYWHDASQLAAIEEVMAEARAEWGDAVVTEVRPCRNDHRAEDYHQHYFARNPGQGYCAYVVAPKVQKFVQTMRDFVRKG
jgi:peptide-methionine (S)-S-oxide reductase